MSEAMTNNEIEDVLSSVRRLVAQEGRRPEAEARNRPENRPDMALAEPSPAAGGMRPQPGRLILTEAQRVHPEAAQPPAPEAAAQPGHLPAPDFRELEATIAELEAAVSASNSAFEGDEALPAASDTAKGNATPGPASNVTELYGKLSFVRRAMEARRAGQEADTAATIQPAPAANTPAAVMAEGGGAAEAMDEPADTLATRTSPGMPDGNAVATAAGAAPPPDDAREDDDFLVEEAIIDEAMLRELVAQLVREELQGQLGERITLQVRKLVRAEIARVLDERRLL